MERYNEINSHIKLLSQETMLLFCVHIAKRLLPNYLYFFRTEGFGNPQIPEQVIDTAKLFFEDYDKAIPQANQLKPALLDVAPHSEDYPSVYSTYALDACIALNSMLELIAENNLQAGKSASDASISTVDVYVQEGGLPTEPLHTLDKRIYDSSQMYVESTFQIKLLKRLTSDAPLADLFDEAFSTTYPLSNIGLQ